MGWNKNKAGKEANLRMGCYKLDSGVLGYMGLLNARNFEARRLVKGCC